MCIEEDNASLLKTEFSRKKLFSERKLEESVLAISYDKVHDKDFASLNLWVDGSLVWESDWIEVENHVPQWKESEKEDMIFNFMDICRHCCLIPVVENANFLNWGIKKFTHQSYKTNVLNVLKEEKKPMNPVDFINHFEIGAADVETKKLREIIWKAVGTPIKLAIMDLIMEGSIEKTDEGLIKLVEKIPDLWEER